MRLLSRFNPVPGFKDLWAELTKPQPYRWPILGVSTIVPLSVLFLISQEHYIAPPEEPEVTYISTFAPDRTDEEIMASNIENLQRKEEAAAREAERIERRKAIYRALGRATGIDVDEMEREIAEEEAREEAAKARQRAIIARQPVEDTGNQ